MTVRSVTVPVRLLNPGDVWRGSPETAAGQGAETVISLVNSWRPENMDITLANQTSHTSRVLTLNRNQNLAVMRNVL